jgi:hypothetical protein
MDRMVVFWRLGGGALLFRKGSGGYVEGGEKEGQGRAGGEKIDFVK